MGYKALPSLEPIELIISQCFWSICVQIHGTILRWHLVTSFNGRVVPENDCAWLYLIIDHCCPKSAWVINALVWHSWQEEQQSPRSTAGRIVPFSVLAVHPFSIAHTFCQIWIIWNEIFHAWYLGRHCSEKQNDSAVSEYGWGKTCVVLLILKNSVDPPLLVPSPLLCYVVLFCFVFFNCCACCQWSPC